MSIDNYQTTSHAPEALERLVECYLALGIPDEARKAAAVLGTKLSGQLLVQAVAEAASTPGAAAQPQPRTASREVIRQASVPHMLRQLAIHNVVLVEQLELEFEPGLGVLTGETGAGKSILLDALGLALGARADTALVRAGQDGASVSAEIELGRDHPAHALLAEQGIELDPGEPLIIRRTLKSDGGSRAFIGGAPRAGRTAPRSRRARGGNPRPARRSRTAQPQGPSRIARRCSAGSTSSVAERVGGGDAHRSRSSVRLAPRPRRPSATASGSSMRAPRSRALAPEEGEETRLAEERAAMQAGVKAGESLTGLDELLGGSEGALAQLRQAARRIERGAADHPLLAEALASLDRALIEASEAEDRIARAADALAFDPARLEQVEARLFDIRGLARKHRVEPDALAALGRADARATRGDRSRRRADRRTRP